MAANVFTPWFLAQLLACALCASVTVHLVRRRSEVGAVWLLLCAGLAGGYAAASLLGTLVSRPESALALRRFGVWLWTGSSLAGLGVALAYAGIGSGSGTRDRILRWGGATASLLLLTWVALADGRLIPEVLLMELGAREGFAPGVGPGQGLHRGLVAGAVLAATGVLGVQLAQAPGQGLRLVAALTAPVLVLGAVLTPWLLPGSIPPWIDPVSIAQVLVVAILGHGLLGSGPLGMEPVARSAVVEEMEDAVLVLGRDGRIVDLNRTARDRLGLRRRGPLPVEIGTLWASSWEALRRDGVPITSRVELELPHGVDVPFELGMTPLGPRAGRGRTVLVLRDITERERMEQELRRASESLYYLANTDALTGLVNRRRFTERLEEEVERAQRYDRPLALVLLDLDHFKKVNDTWGHPTGDRVLEATAEALRRVLREMDLAGRLGGEEFAILLPETDATGAAALGERVRREIRDTVHRSDAGAPFHVTASLGVSWLSPGDDPDGEALLSMADRALYGAKAGGRDRVVSKRIPVAAGLSA
ncbi:MAG: GGDEF domain-containing protein [Gemmatimonadota bacterium]